MVKIIVLLSLASAACGGAAFTTGDPASVDPASSSDPNAQVSDPPPVIASPVVDAGTIREAAPAPSTTSTVSAPPPPHDAGIDVAIGCIQTPYANVCPDNASAWPLCGHHPDGCGGFYDCGEPCPEPPDAAPIDSGVYVVNGACAKLSSCQGCSVIGAVTPVAGLNCQTALQNDDATSCSSFLATLQGQGVCN